MWLNYPNTLGGKQVSSSFPASWEAASLRGQPSCDRAIRAAERKWPWEVLGQSIPKSKKLWKPKVHFITQNVTKCTWNYLQFSRIPLTTCMITPCWPHVRYMINGLHTYCLLKPRNIHINFKIYLSPLVACKGEEIVLNIESDFTGFASEAPVCIPDTPCILQNAH